MTTKKLVHLLLTMLSLTLAGNTFGMNTPPRNPQRILPAPKKEKNVITPNFFLYDYPGAPKLIGLKSYNNTNEMTVTSDSNEDYNRPSENNKVYNLQGKPLRLIQLGEGSDLAYVVDCLPNANPSTLELTLRDTLISYAIQNRQPYVPHDHSFRDKDTN